MLHRFKKLAIEKKIKFTLSKERTCISPATTTTTTHHKYARKKVLNFRFVRLF